MEDEIRTRRNFPAETWAVIRDAYLGGETAESISRRLKISINTIRKRASRCGWTHAAHAAAIARMSAEHGDAWFEPDQALDRVTRHAAQLLSEGRASEAQGLIRAAEGLKRLTQHTPRPGEPEPMTIEEEDRQAAAAHAEMAEIVNAVVEHLVHEVLSQHPEGVPGMYEAFVYRFRAQHFGPRIEAADRAHAVARGWSLEFWDDDGRLLPDIAVGPSGQAPRSTEPPHGHNPRDANVCCHWAEWLQTELREGRAGDWRMGSGGEVGERG